MADFLLLSNMARFGRQTLHPSPPPPGSAKDDCGYIFLEFPDLVVQHILQFLPLPDLQNLRRVCKTTKAWVEIPKFLQLFRVRITNDLRMVAVLHSPVLWNNFSYPFYRMETKSVAKQNYKKFLLSSVCEKYGETLRSIHFDHFVFPIQCYGISEDVFSLPSLTSLSITLLQFKPGYESDLEKMSNVLEQLTELRLSEVDTGDSEINPLEKFLSGCTRLTRLEFSGPNKICRNYGFGFGTQWLFIHWKADKTLGRKLMAPVIIHLLDASKWNYLKEVKFTNSELHFSLNLATRITTLCAQRRIKLHLHACIKNGLFPGTSVIYRSESQFGYFHLK